MEAPVQIMHYWAVIEEERWEYSGIETLHLDKANAYKHARKLTVRKYEEYRECYLAEKRVYVGEDGARISKRNGHFYNPNEYTRYYVRAHVHKVYA
jgi:hypothetical protein